MNTKESDYLLSYYSLKKKRALKNLNLIDKIRGKETTLEEINSNIVFTISDLPDHFSLLKVESEIRKNVLEIKDENGLLQYFYYLIKIHHKLKRNTKGINESIQYLKNRYNAIYEIAEIDIFQSKYNSFEELIFHCYWELDELFSCSIQFYCILKDEFGFKVKEWKDKVVNKVEMPSFFEIKSMFLNNESEGNLNKNLEVKTHELRTPNNEILNGTRIRIHEKRQKEKEELAEREDALNNTLLYKFISFFNWIEDEKEQSEFVQRVVSELKQANILNIFRDDYLTEGKKIIVDESVKRLEKYIETVRKENVNKEEPIAGFKNEPLPETIQSIHKRLKWKGTPSQFGFIIDLLIQGGYLEKPTSSFAKDANFYLQFFDIETTNTTLAKELSEGTNSLATKNRKKITIPNKDKLD